MTTVAVKDIKWGQAICAGLCLLLGFGIIGIGCAMAYTWATSSYVERKFVPYRTALTQMEPGYNFAAGYPSVEVPFDTFVKESNGKSFILSYPAELTSKEQINSSETVYYLMLKSGPGGRIYLLAKQQIPDYNTSTYGSLGYIEHTAFDAKQLIYYSVKDGTAYGFLLLGLAIVVIGFFVFAFSVIGFGDALSLL